MSRPVTRKDLLLVVIVLALLAGFTGIAQGSGLLPGLQPPAAPDVPSGAVMYFNASTCPSGWSDLTAARGRYIVALGPGGTLGGTQGTALADLENRAIGKHTHDLTDPGHGHSIFDPGHGHTAVDAGHAHGITDPGHSHSTPDYITWHCPGGCNYGIGGVHEPYDFQDSWPDVTGTSTTGIAVNTGLANVTVAGAQTGITVFNQSTGISVDDAGVITGTNAPYIQLLVCQKN